MKEAISVNVLRGTNIESRHLVDVVILNSNKKIIEQYGNIEKPIYPRSAIKMLQALLIIESGAYESLKLNLQHLALASSSHFGEDIHTDLVLDWLKTLNLNFENLRCGPQMPYRDSVRDRLIKSDRSPARYHNNCSGKHSGILSICKHSGFDTTNYDEYNHPVQQQLIKLLSELYEFDLSKSYYGVDGCGIPTIGVPLLNMALGYVNFTKNPHSHLILEGVRKYPDLVSGPGNFCSEITKITNGRVFAKVGAEGVYTAFSTEDDFFMAMKVHDGTGRASQFLCANLIKKYCHLSENEVKQLQKFINPPIKNWEGKVVGSFEVCL